MKINIIDAGMSSLNGHHADINLRLAREFASRGHDVAIYGHKAFPENQTPYPVHRLFSIEPYNLLPIMAQPAQNPKPNTNFDLAAHVFSTELQAIPPADISLFPTLFSYQLAVLGAHRSRLNRTYGALHVHPSFNNPAGSRLWKAALARSLPGMADIRLGVFEPELLLEYELLLPDERVRIHEFPIPHDGSGQGLLQSTLATVGILGHQRQTKGAGNLRHTAGELVSRGFDIIIQDSAGRYSTTADANPKIKTRGYVPDMGALIRECGAVLLDYDPGMYRYSGSGIAWECIASGVPFLAPQGTTISRLVRTYGTGGVFCSAEPSSKFRLLETMRDGYSEYLRLAENARTIYQQRHGTARFVDYILGEDRA